MKKSTNALLYSLLGFVMTPGLGYFYLNKFRLGMIIVIVQVVLSFIFITGVWNFMSVNEYEIVSNVGFEITLQHVEKLLESGNAPPGLIFLENILYIQLGVMAIQPIHIYYMIRKKQI